MMTWDDEDDLAEPLDRCYRHPDEETALRCLECDRPVCVDCAVQGAVGIKCPEHARLSRAARAQVPVQRLGAGAAVAAVLGVLAGAVLYAVQVRFFGIILALLVGMGIGELTRRSTGGYRDATVSRIAAAGAGLGVALPLVVDVLRGLPIGVNATFIVFELLGAAAAAWGAWTRASS